MLSESLWGLYFRTYSASYHGSLDLVLPPFEAGFLLGYHENLPHVWDLPTPRSPLSPPASQDDWTTPPAAIPV
jgi:hypothetical protein